MIIYSPQNELAKICWHPQKFVYANYEKKSSAKINLVKVYISRMGYART